MENPVVGRYTYPEVGGAGGEDDPVRPEELPVGAEGDVDEGLLLEQRVEHGEDRRAVVVPLQAELLLLGGGGARAGGGGARHGRGGGGREGSNWGGKVQKSGREGSKLGKGGGGGGGDRVGLKRRGADRSSGFGYLSPAAAAANSASTN